jgi:hypothetical protein
LTKQWWRDDDELFAALDEALREARAVPRRFVEAGKAAYAWHNVDAELAALTYDSAAAADREDRELAITRAEPAPLRSLTFASGRLRIQLEVTHEALLGQVVPAQAAAIELRTAVDRRDIAVDELGWFRIRPIPTGSFRLHCRPAEGPAVLTDWITL